MAEFSTFAADSHQTPNVPGVRRFWKIRSKAFTGTWPLLADTITGEITSNPLIKLPDYFVPAEYIVPPNTKDGKFNNLPEVGYENYVHSFEYEMAGLGKDLMAELMKNRNAQSVYIIEDTDEQLWLLGSSGRGLTETINGGFGKLGNDKRGLTISATSDGHAWPALPLSDEMASKFLLRAKGYGPFYQQNIYFTYTWAVSDEKSFKLADDMRSLLPLIDEFSGGTWRQRPAMPYNEGDEVLITKGNVGTAPNAHTSKSLSDGWVKANIVMFDGDFVYFEATAKSVGTVAGSFFVFHQPRPTYTGFTISEDPSDGYFGALAFGYTGGTLPYVAGQMLYIYNVNGSGVTRKIRAFFVSRVGNVVNVNVQSCDELFIAPTPPTTTGYEVTLDTAQS